jgi:virulence-associated protein VagC
MSSTAKVFKSGNSQAVRLPRALRFPDGVKSVTVTRDGERLVLEAPKRTEFSSRFWKALGSLEGFERPPQMRQRRRRMFP